MVGGSIIGIVPVSMISKLDVPVVAAVLHDVDTKFDERVPSRVRLRLGDDVCNDGCGVELIRSAIFVKYTWFFY